MESRSDLDAVLVFGHRPNHVLHLILTVITVTAWAPVWLVVALVVKERRVTLAVDEWGRVLKQG